MRSSLAFLAVASLTVGGFVLPASAEDRADVSIKADAGTTTRPADNTAEAPDAHNIRITLASIVSAAVGGRLDNLRTYFRDEDGNRIKFDKPDKLQDTTANFEKAWKDKYNVPFSVVNNKDIYTDQFVRIRQMEMNDAQPAGEHMIPATRPADRINDPKTMDKDDTKLPAKADVQLGDRDARMAADTNRDADKDAKADRGGSEAGAGPGFAHLAIAASHGLPELRLNLIRQRHWVLDVPENVDAARIETNLQREFDDMLAHKDQWPAEVNDGYRLVSHHVFAALQDKSASAKTDMHRTDDMKVDVKTDRDADR